jgi:putative nucleotidyltransferase with HDIG domain
MSETLRGSSRILIVDDDEGIRSVLFQFLSQTHECVLAHSAFEALNKIRHNQFALAISDVMMPGMTGMELLRLIKKHHPETAVIMLTGALNVHMAVDALRLGATDFVTKPFQLEAVQRAVERALDRRQIMIDSREYRKGLEQKVQERTLELNGALHEIEESYKITLEALVMALDAREHETQAHSLRVREYSLTLARELGLPPEQVVHIGRGALLHDVGKIGVPDSILLKPAKLTAEEWNEMKKHPQIGYEILSGIDFLAPAAAIVLAHQERWDGTGYPKRLRHTEIPLGARIFAVVDAVDAMTSDRPYRMALSFEYAIEEVRRCTGTQFDPGVAEAFLGMPLHIWTRIHDSINDERQAQLACEMICPC